MTKKSDILRAIRLKCVDCCCGSVNEVRNCGIDSCTLHPYRLGADPAPARRGRFEKNDSPEREFLIENNEHIPNHSSVQPRLNTSVEALKNNKTSSKQNIPIAHNIDEGGVNK